MHMLPPPPNVATPSPHPLNPLEDKGALDLGEDIRGKHEQVYPSLLNPSSTACKTLHIQCKETDSSGGAGGHGGEDLCLSPTNAGLWKQVAEVDSHWRRSQIQGHMISPH